MKNSRIIQFFPRSLEALADTNKIEELKCAMPSQFALLPDHKSAIFCWTSTRGVEVTL